MKQVKYKKIREKEKEEEHLDIETISLEDLHDPIVILEDPTKYDYVRKGKFACLKENKKPIKKEEEHYKLLAYEKPHKTPDIPGKKTLISIYFYLRDHDRDMPNEHHNYARGSGIAPAEAVKVVEEEKP